MIDGLRGLTDRTMPRRLWTAVAVLGLLAGVLAGCGRGQKPVPPGAQLVHVVVTGSGVGTNPSAVHAGQVYLVLDEPLDGSFGFVERKRTAEATPGPLSDDDVARLAHGDTEGTSISTMSIGCDAAQQAEDRGQMGYCGNVWMLVLAEGKYAILGAGFTEQETEPSVDPTAGPHDVLPPSIAILEVLP